MDFRLSFGLFCSIASWGSPQRWGRR